MEALADDEQLAEQLASMPEPAAKAPTRRMSDWSIEVEMWTAILNRLGELIQTVAATAGAKSHKVPTAPYPVTAVDRARRRRREQRHRSIVDRVLPRRPRE